MVPQGNMYKLSISHTYLLNVLEGNKYINIFVYLEKYCNIVG